MGLIDALIKLLQAVAVGVTAGVVSYYIPYLIAKGWYKGKSENNNNAPEYKIIKHINDEK